MDNTIDILVIGAGITGCAVARALSRFQCSVGVLDRACDVAEGATKANSGIVHAGYDAMPGTQKAYYNVRGAAMYPALCRELGVPYRQNGSLVIGFDEKEKQHLAELKARGEQNGVQGLELLDREAALRLQPNLNPEAYAALRVPTGAIVSPYELAFALADDAALNGVIFAFDQEVTSLTREPDGMFAVRTGSGVLRCRALVNCAGASGAALHNLLSEDKKTMVNRRGQYYLLDRAAEQPFDMTVFQCPSEMGKGVLVTPTVHGNLLLGPTAEDVEDPMDTATTAEGLAQILKKASRTWPGLSTRTNITNFSGIRAHLTTDDFIVGPCADVPGLFEAIGIESPGLSSAPAIAEVLSGAIAAYLRLKPKEKTAAYPLPPVPFREMTPEEQAAAVARDPAYGNLICRCEVVTEAEIRQAIRRPVGARTVDGVKRRTRAGMGRCQGGFCMPRVAAILAEETGVPLTAVTKDGGNSYLLDDTVASFLKGEAAHE